MMNNCHDIRRYSPKNDDRFILDTNIWAYLYCNVPAKKYFIREYSGFFKKIINSGASIFISSLILSEFIKIYHQIEFEYLKLKDPMKYVNYKSDYRNTHDYCVAMKDVKNVLTNNIMKCAKPIDDKFKSITIEQLIDDIENCDFNDKYHAILAKIENLSLVTNDGDYQSKSINNINIPIYTCNDKLLKPK